MGAMTPKLILLGLDVVSGYLGFAYQDEREFVGAIS